MAKKGEREAIIIEEEIERKHKGLVFGILLILVGVVWLSKEFGWIPADVPIWPIVLIVIGLLIVIDKSLTT